MAVSGYSIFRAHVICLIFFDMNDLLLKFFRLISMWIRHNVYTCNSSGLKLIRVYRLKWIRKMISFWYLRSAENGNSFAIRIRWEPRNLLLFSKDNVKMSTIHMSMHGVYHVLYIDSHFHKWTYKLIIGFVAPNRETYYLSESVEIPEIYCCSLKLM